MLDDPIPVGATPEAAAGTLFYAWSVVALLALAYAIAFIDRQIVSLVVGPLRAEFSLSNFQIGLLQGPAFGLFYTIMGLPLGWLADRWSRRYVIAGGMALWSLMTCACGFAQSFSQLLSARIGVGIGEASLQPAAIALIGDYFTGRNRGLAISVFVASGSVGIGLAFALGGNLIDALSVAGPVIVPVFGSVEAWRVTFVIVGLPGLLLAGFVALIRDPAMPRRKQSSPAVPQMSLSKQAFVPGGFRVFLWHTGAIAAYSVIAFGLLAWLPSYFQQTHGWSMSQFGTRYGPIYVLCGVAGAISGGIVARRLQMAGSEEGTSRVVFAGLIAAPITGALGLLSTSPWLGLALFGATAFTMPFPVGVAPAVVQDMVRNEFRARLTALYYTIVGVTGLSVGAPLVGWLTDRGAESNALRTSLVEVHVIFGILAITCAWRALRSYPR